MSKEVMVVIGRGRALFAGFGLVWACACNTSRPPVATNEQQTESRDETTAEQDSSSSENDTSSFVDAGSSATSTGSSSASSAPVSSDAESLGSSSTSSEQVSLATGTDDAGPAILPPVIEEVTVAELCERVEYLTGETIDVDLRNEVTTGEWFLLREGPVAGLDAGLDAAACGERFAPYVVSCRGSVLVLSAPSRAFGEGAEVGGESVGVGCWEAECENGCLPEAGDGFGKVRLRVGPVIDARFDEALSLSVGDVRVNGVDVECLAELELSELL